MHTAPFITFYPNRLQDRSPDIQMPATEGNKGRGVPRMLKMTHDKTNMPLEIFRHKSSGRIILNVKGDSAKITRK